jgi:hypothetical protein
MTDTNYEGIDISLLNTYNKDRAINIRNIFLAFGGSHTCFRCHSLINISGQHLFLIQEDNIIKYICSQCLAEFISNNDHMLTCECCGNRFHKLIKHHWYDPHDYSKCYSKTVCLFCNAKLNCSNLWGERHYNANKWLNLYGWYHILPNFELQRLYISNPRQYKQQRIIEYPFPLPRPKEEFYNYITNRYNIDGTKKSVEETNNLYQIQKDNIK